MGKRDARRNEILDIAKQMMVDTGVEQTTMLRIAQEAGASKETLYNWFGTKTGLIEALCLREAEIINDQLASALGDDSRKIESVLENLAMGLMNTLLGEWSLAVNRAAMQSPEIATTVLQSGRFTVGPMVADYLERQAAVGRIRIESGDAAFRMLFGLIMQDSQIRALLWNRAEDPEIYSGRARIAVQSFLKLVAV
ncbi:MAG: TetR/AcrR family transcriptional regulator [Thermomicrobiales bacterium]|nr:TetR/AcrR family transcriptional regulator [Thermomicrobiales bacterium]MCO5225894.1 TetR/AcrR family transcriptional regulator [Thermomicrobiales bacterium]